MPHDVDTLYNSLYPPGMCAEPDEDLCKFNKATADNVEETLELMAEIATFRDPDETVILSDLEKEYGIATNENLSDEERRYMLSLEKYKIESDGSIDTLTAKIQEVFPNITAYENDPVNDPQTVVGESPFMVADGGNAYADYIPDVAEDWPVAGVNVKEGYVLANGQLYEIDPVILSVADNMYADDTDNCFADYHTEVEKTEIIYPITRDPNRWAYFLFVGGSVIRGGSGEIISIATIQIPEEKRNTLEKIILELKPLVDWVIMAIEYI